jgi:hypothetical protein
MPDCEKRFIEQNSEPQTENADGPRHDKILGICCLAFGAILALTWVRRPSIPDCWRYVDTLVAALNPATPLRVDDWRVALSTSVIGLILVFAGSKWVVLGAKLCKTPIANLEMLQSRAYVLFLRSFVDEQYYTTAHDREIMFALHQDSIEEVVGAADKDIGQLVALGRPGDDLHPLGAERAYIATSNWRSDISELMASVRLVIVRLPTGSTSTTEGLLWEIRVAKEILRPNLTNFSYSRLLFAASTDSNHPGCRWLKTSLVVFTLQTIPISPALS